MFDFRYLASDADFDIEYRSDGLVVSRRTTAPEAQAAMLELYDSLSLCELGVSIGPYKDWVRVENGKVDLNSLSCDIADQLNAEGISGMPRFTVVNNYEEPQP